MTNATDPAEAGGNGQGRGLSGPVAAAQHVLDRKTAEKVDGVLLDVQTANAIVTVANALSPESRTKLEAMSLPRAAAVCWTLVSRTSNDR